MTEHRPIPARLSGARGLLGVSGDAGEHEVRQAFRRAARADHPDAGGQGVDLRALCEARDLLLRNLRTHPPHAGRQRVFVKRSRPLARVGRRLLARRRPGTPTRRIW